MAGIAGIISESEQFGKEEVDSMLEVISHRGKGRKEIFRDRNVCMGIQYHDKKEGLNDSSDQICLFDGTIYNKEELKEISRLPSELEIENPELVKKLYERNGTSEFSEIDGDYVFVLWDSDKEKLLFSKYLTNNKNIFYFKHEGNLFFASEIKALLAIQDIEINLDYSSISDFLTFGHIPSPYTIFKDVMRLPPMSLISYENSSFKRKSLDFFDLQRDRVSSVKRAIKEVYKSLEDSVRKRILDKRNCGLLLSGGIDSSTLLHFLDKNLESPVKTFTAGIKEDKKYARRVSEFFGSDHTEVTIDENNLVKIAPKSIWHLEYPLDHPGVFQYYFVKASEDIDYVFWGQGAEEPLFGRKDYLALDIANKRRKIFPNILNEYLSNKFSGIPKTNTFNFIVNSLFSDNPEEAFVNLREIMSSRERGEMFGEKVIENKSDRLVCDRSSGDLLKDYSYVTMRNGFLSDTYFNIGQETLNPYLSKDFLDLCFAIPTKIKIKNFEKRYVMKKMMKEHLPNFIINRGRDTWSEQTKKMVSTKKELFYEYAEKLRSRKILKDKVSDFSRKYRYKFDEKLWSLFTLEILLELFHDRRTLKEPNGFL